MKMGVGTLTCKRFGYLKKTLDSLFNHNPSLKDLPLIIADDASPEETVLRIKQNWPWATVIHHPKRKGYPKNVRWLITTAESMGLDVIYWCTNDIECVRPIDFKSLLGFFENPKVGQVQFLHWKGKIGDPKRERANKNWTTKEQIKREPQIYVGKEILVPGNWSWTSYTQMQRLGVTNFGRKAVEKNPKIEIRMVEAGLIMMRNWHATGLQNYECQDQPFMNQDADGTNNTGYEDV